MAEYKARRKTIRPSYYQGGGIEAIDYITLLQAPFDIGNVIKYVARAGKKPRNTAMQDIAKAKFYLDHYIWHMDREKTYQLCDGLSDRPEDIKVIDFLEAMGVEDCELVEVITCIDKAFHRIIVNADSVFSLLITADDCLQRYLKRENKEKTRAV